MCVKQLQLERKAWRKMLNISRNDTKKGNKGYKWEAATGMLGLSTTRINAGSGICRLEVAKPAQVSHTGNTIFLALEEVYAEYCKSGFTANGLKTRSKDFANSVTFCNSCRHNFWYSLLWMWPGLNVTKFLCLGSFGVLCANTNQFQRGDGHLHYSKIFFFSAFLLPLAVVLGTPCCP